MSQNAECSSITIINRYRYIRENNKERKKEKILKQPYGKLFKSKQTKHAGTARNGHADQKCVGHTNAAKISRDIRAHHNSPNRYVRRTTDLRKPLQSSRRPATV